MLRLQEMHLSATVTLQMLTSVGAGPVHDALLLPEYGEVLVKVQGESLP